MAWSTSNSADIDVRNALSNGDAVPTGHDPNILNGHIRASFHMDSISVGAVLRGMNFEVSSFEILAMDDTKVDILAVDRYYAIDDCI